VQLSEGTIIAERFRLVHLLGQGGMGAVWRAHHIALDIPCAIKFMLGEAATFEDVRARFEREARAAAQLKSPHVIQILDHGVCDGTPYIAMELLEGEDLERRLLRLGRIDPRAVANITIQVARALAKAHAAGVVHRDLKPANIYLARDGDDEVVKVLDFGIAKRATPGMAGNTKTGTLLGTLYYMSPEQARGLKAVDHRSDLWSLGVVVYECLTGQLPFQSDAFGDLLISILFDPLPVPSQVTRVLPGFDAWWARAAAREPAERFQSAKELAEALVAVVDAAANESPAGAECPRACLPSAETLAIDAVAPGVSLLGTVDGSGRTPLRSIAGLSVSAPGSTPPNRRRAGFVAAAAVAVVGIVAAAVLAIPGGENAAPPAAPAITASPDAPKAVASADAREVFSGPAITQHTGPQSAIVAAPSPSATPLAPRKWTGKPTVPGSAKPAEPPPMPGPEPGF